MFAWPGVRVLLWRARKSSRPDTSLLEMFSLSIMMFLSVEDTDKAGRVVEHSWHFHTAA